jgi:oxygen-independent coproporphyrinogen-3 oxidase
MAGIYLHIPFCHYKCHYCNFYSLASFKYKDDFVPHLIKEIEARKDEMHGLEIDTIYFGGGTPSTLVVEDIEEILNTIQNHYQVNRFAEVTFEANPEDISRCYARELSEVGINRLSLGTQAFDEKLLEKLNRDHSVQHSIRAVKYAQDAGFDNISIDLIYGIPDLTHEAWKESLRKALEMNVAHISAYHLTVEPGTALKKLIEKKKYPMPNDALSMEQFDILLEELTEHGYEHYEISNFAKQRKYSKHNSSYWLNKPYIGFGPSAHSYNLNSRRWNVRNLKKYYEGVSLDRGYFEFEELNEVDRYNEFVMLRLRTIWGVDANELENLFGVSRKVYFEKSIEAHLKNENVSFENGIYYLTAKGKKFADGIAADCFLDV